MSARLRDLIKDVRSCKTAAEERATIAKECANIRSSFKEEEAENRHRNVAKLLYIHMLGYPTHWGQMECLKLIASQYYSDKRIGYLGAMILMDEKQELLTMATNHMKNDLNHPSHFVAGLALCALGNISSAGIARDLAPEVEKLLGSSNLYLRKKAALCAIRVLRKCPDLMENFVPRIRSLLSEKNHGVLITGVSLMIELCETEPQNVEFFRRLVPTLVRILKNLVMSGLAPEYDVSGVTDPFLQVKILRLLRYLGKGDNESSDIMNDILAQVATNTDHSRNVGNAILYECVQTIMTVESEKDLRLLAINVLGSFLSNKDNNIRYVALNTLTKVVAADAEAVQRHRNTIVECLRDPDVSIRRRALDLIYALVNESNVKVLVGEMLNFLQTSTAELKADLTTKLCSVTERFSPSKRWQVDTLLKVMGIAGNHVPDEVASNFVTLIASTPDLQPYAVQKVYLALSKDINSQVLVRVAAWSLGEFGDLLLSGGGDEPLTVSEGEVIDLLLRAMRATSSLVTREYLLTAFIKLTARFPQSVNQLNEIIRTYQNNIDAELQQRATEYSQLETQGKIDRKTLFERIPVVEVKETTAAVVHVPQTSSDSLIGWDDINPVSSPTPQGSQPSPSGGTPNLLDPMAEIFGLGSGSSSTPTPSPAPTGGFDPMKDLLGLDTVASPAPASPSLTPTPPIVAQTPPAVNGASTMNVLQRNGLTVTFDLVKNASHPNVTMVNASFTNSQANPMTNFEFKVAVPKYIKLQVNPPSSTTVPPNNSGKVTQNFKLLNSLHGEKQLLAKIKLDFQLNGSPVSEIADVTFP